MRTRFASVAALLLGLVVVAPTASAQADRGLGWTTPGCSEVGSDATLSYTRDEMATITPATGMTHTTKYQTGLATLATPGFLLAVDSQGRVNLSADSGCNWLYFDKLSGYAAYSEVVAAPDGTAYIWTKNNRLFRYANRTVTELPAPAAERDSATALTVDPSNSEHVRIVTEDPQILDSTDGGQTFQVVGAAATQWSIYDAAIDPLDMDHIVIGTSGEGARVTHDGGATWTSVGLGAPGERVNAFTVAISPANADIVYVQGLNLAEHDRKVAGEGRHLYRSTDGGLTFTPIVTQGGEITLANGIMVVPHPSDPDVVYFTWGTSFMGIGSYLYRYDADTDATTFTRTWYHRINSIAFNPLRPSIMYLGFGLEKIS